MYPVTRAPQLGVLTYTMVHWIISERRSAQRGDDLDFSRLPMGGLDYDGEVV